MSVMRFSIPRDIIYGENALDHLSQLKGKRAMLVTGGSSLKRLGFLDKAAALLQQAALSLLGRRGVGPGSVANRLGLDEVGIKGGGDGTDAAGAALTMGKRLSDKLYLTYEQSLSGAMGIIYIFYDLTKRLTLRGQTGSQSAVDIIYTVDKD